MLILQNARAGSDAVFFTPAPEGSRVQTQDPGRFFQGFGSRQHLADMHFLDGLQGNQIAHFRRRRRRGEMQRQTLRADGVTGTEQDRPLDDIAQLPDIAGPGVISQSRFNRVGEAQDAAMVLAGQKGEQALRQGQDILLALPSGGTTISTTFNR